MKDVKGPSATHARPSSLLSLMTGWVQQGVESFLATQRILVDLAMRKNASAMKSIREGLTDPEHSPVAILTEVAVEGTANFIEAQRILLNLVQQQNEIVMTGVKERVGDYPQVTAVTEILRRSIDTVVDMQQEFLTMVSKQAQSWVEPAKAIKGYDANHLADMAREAMDNFVKAQKKFLDIVAEETEKAGEGKVVKKSTKTDLSKMARESANALIEAQKKLLDLAGHQIDVGRDVVNRTRDLIGPIDILPMANITGKGVKNFIDAERDLINSMKEPHNGKVAPKTVRRARRTGRQRKTETAKAAVTA